MKCLKKKFESQYGLHWMLTSTNWIVRSLDAWLATWLINALTSNHQTSQIHGLQLNFMLKDCYNNTILRHTIPKSTRVNWMVFSQTPLAVSYVSCVLKTKKLKRKITGEACKYNQNLIEPCICFAQCIQHYHSSKTNTYLKIMTEPWS